MISSGGVAFKRTYKQRALVEQTTEFVKESNNENWIVKQRSHRHNTAHNRDCITKRKSRPTRRVVNAVCVQSPFKWNNHINLFLVSFVVRVKLASYLFNKDFCHYLLLFSSLLFGFVSSESAERANEKFHVDSAKCHSGSVLTMVHCIAYRFVAAITKNFQFSHKKPQEHSLVPSAIVATMLMPTVVIISFVRKIVIKDECDPRVMRNVIHV